MYAALARLTPLVGGLAASGFLTARIVFDGATVAQAGEAFSFWGPRDVLLGYFLALPALAVARRLGATHFLWFWLVAAIAGMPMGYVLANPVEFDWAPTEADFDHGPYWELMYLYAVLFGMTGAAYGFLLRRAFDNSGGKSSEA